MKKYKNRGEIWSYVSLFLFQDSLEVLLFILSILTSQVPGIHSKDIKMYEN